MSAAKAKGTAAETAVVEYLKQWFPHVERRTLSGKNDRGDINFHPDVVIEVKNQQRMELSTWVDEAITEGRNASAWVSAVWHKRPRKGNPGDWYVTMDGSTFAGLLRLIQAYHEEIKFLEDVDHELGKLVKRS